MIDLIATRLLRSDQLMAMSRHLILLNSLKELRDNYANAAYESDYYDTDNLGSITNDYKVQAEDLLMDDIDFKKTLGRLGFKYRNSDLTFGVKLAGSARSFWCAFVRRACEQKVARL